jgi:FkbM family methyltransferase
MSRSAATSRRGATHGEYDQIRHERSESGTIITIRNQFLRYLPDGALRQLGRFVPDECRLVFKVMEDRSGSGVMVDVGACRGAALAPFAGDGWTVYAFEPDTVNRAELEATWGNTPDVHIDTRAVSDKVQTDLPFFRSDVSEGISGLSAFHESHEEAGTVDATTVDEVVREHGIGHIDFLKVDTEGHDLFVLEGVDWDNTPPDVVVCEFEDAKTVPLGYSFDDLAMFLTDRGYTVVVSEWYPVVGYGMQHTWRGFATYPCALADPDAWGNLIAVRDARDSERLLAVLDRTSRLWRIGGPAKRFLKS